MMKTLRLAFTLLFFFASLPFPLARASAQPSVLFDDSDPNLLIIRGDTYELRLSKANGAIAGLLDRAAGEELQAVSRYGCLWGMGFPDGTPTANYIGGCTFDKSWPNAFTYTWDAATSTLVLHYQWGAGTAQSVNAEVTFTAAGDYFDGQIAVQNLWGARANVVLFPSDLLLPDAAISAAYGTFMLPGVRLKPSFFTSDAKGGTALYPGANAFADFLSLDFNGGGRLAFYAYTPPPSPIAPVYLGFINDQAANPGKFYTYHSFPVYLENNQLWTSPVIRFRVGQEIRQAINAYRGDNTIDYFPSVAQKLGDSRYQQIIHAPFLKADINAPFTTWAGRFGQLTAPSILHLVGFQPRGFDQNYPDFLPPDPRWGTTEQLRALAGQAQASGHLVIPYINPTWWDDESPTIQAELPAAGLTINDVAVINPDGTPRYETYPPNGGYAVSPYPDFVKNRLARLLDQWKTEVPVNCILEDQIGARGWVPDFNAASPTRLSYADGWLAHTKLYAPQCLMTEMGYDRLAQTEVGFHGSLKVNYANPDSLFGAGNWEPYPLANMLFGDKVLLYQHDLAEESMTRDLSMLTFNAAFGYMLSYIPNWATLGTTPDPWLDTVTIFQRSLASRYAGATVADFQNLTPSVTRTDFSPPQGAALSVIANWGGQPYASPSGAIAPGGFLATTADGSLTAGVLVDSFNGQPLTPGSHTLVIERSATQAVIWQPLGAATALAINVPSAWQPGLPLALRAEDAANHRISSVGIAPVAGKVTFTYEPVQNGQPVHHYHLEVVRKFFIPAIAR